MAKVKITTPIYIRKGPGKSHDILGAIYPSGKDIEMDGIEKGENLKGIDDWYYKVNEKGEKQSYWAGGTSLIEAAAPIPNAEPASPILGWGLQKLSISDFWNNAGNRGAGITIAILDTGITPDHPEFNYSRIRQFNILSNTKNAEDKMGHGTHVAGIIAASGKEMTGVAPNVNLLIIKVAETENAWTISNINKGIDHAIEQQADIISISAEFEEEDNMINDLKSKISEAIQAGIVIVASAGNNFNSFPVESYPAAIDACISVGSIQEDGTRADSSTHSTKLDIVAPGEHIYSTWLNKKYETLSGTSMSAPLVAGIIAILKSFARTKHKKELTPSEIQVILTKTADDAGISGFDTSYGFGVINPSNALQMIKN